MYKVFNSIDLSRLGLALGVPLQEGFGFDGSCQRGRLTAEEEVSTGHHLASTWQDCKSKLYLATSISCQEQLAAEVCAVDFWQRLLCFWKTG